MVDQERSSGAFGHSQAGYFQGGSGGIARKALIPKIKVIFTCKEEYISGFVRRP